eukprot:gene22710-biopygen23046
MLDSSDEETLTFIGAFLRRRTMCACSVETRRVISSMLLPHTAVSPLGVLPSARHMASSVHVSSIGHNRSLIALRNSLWKPFSSERQGLANGVTPRSSWSSQPAWKVPFRAEKATRNHR